MYSSLKMDGKCGKVHSDAVQIFQMWYLLYLTGINPHLLQMQIHCLEANHTRETTLHTVRKHLSL
jgi:hypothetical protein